LPASSNIVAEALDLSVDALLAQAGLLPDEPDHPSPACATTTTVRTDPTLIDGQTTVFFGMHLLERPLGSPAGS